MSSPASPPASPLEARARRAVPLALWERGEAYTRAGAVSVVARSAEEERWRVAQPGVRAPVEVTIWPPDGEWACTCEAEGCAHIAAVCVARRSGSFVVAAAPAEVRYHLRVHEQALVFEREAPPDAPRRPEDQELNRILGGWWGRPGVPKGLVAQALGALRGLPVDLDGTPVRTDGRPVLPRVVVDEEGRGWKARLARASGIRDAYRNGAVRIADAPGAPGSGAAASPDAIRPIGDVDVTPELRQRLVLGIVFAPAEVERLVTQFLPDLRRLVEVEVRCASLPQARAVPPRLDWEVVGREGRLRVVPRIVYGDPPNARVERGELIRIGGPIVIRDVPAERRLEATLSEETGGLVPGMTVEREGAAAAIWADGLKGSAREAVLRAAPGLRIDRRAVDVQVRVGEAGDAYTVTVEAGGVTAEALLAAWNSGEPLVPLLGGGWRPAPREWLERHGALLAEVLAARGADGKVPRHTAPLLLDDLDALGAAIPPGLQALRALGGDFSAVPAVALPDTFRGALRPYQQRGVDWICWLASVGMGGVLADDMGLGKTVQCLAAMAFRRAAGLGAPTLVVAPTSVLRNWAAESARFTPSLRVNVYHGGGRTLDTPADLVLTTWALLRLDVEIFAARTWDLLILDEAQAAKNPDSQVAAAARRMQAALRLAVTGTPVENRLEELWSLFHIVNPGLLGGRTVFRDRFARPIADGSRAARDQLRKRIRPFTLRRMKAEVAADLPPRTDVVLRCTLSEREREIYQSVASLGRAEVASLLSGGRTLQVLEVLLRMRQAACHTGLLTTKGLGAAMSGSGAPSSAKVDLLMEELEEVFDNPGEERHRALVFSQWTSLLDLVEPQLRARGIRFVRLDGSTRDRAGVVAQFNDPDGPEVFLLSLTAGGTGLNLVAADYVFLLDPWWNPAVEQQATDRAHRIGQTRPVVAYRLVAEDTVEERILELQGRKRELAKAALDESVLAQSLAREDILALFD